jgi:hypothetical protein
MADRSQLTDIRPRVRFDLRSPARDADHHGRSRALSVCIDRSADRGRRGHNTAAFRAGRFDLLMPRAAWDGISSTRARRQQAAAVIGLALCAVVGAGYSGGGGQASMVTTGPAPFKGVPSQAAVNAALLTVSDLPTGFTTMPPIPSNAPTLCGLPEIRNLAIAQGEVDFQQQCVLLPVRTLATSFTPFLQASPRPTLTASRARSVLVPPIPPPSTVRPSHSRSLLCHSPALMTRQSPFD